MARIKSSTKNLTLKDIPENRSRAQLIKEKLILWLNEEKESGNTIGEVFGITRQRVAQIIQENKTQTK